MPTTPLAEAKRLEWLKKAGAKGLVFEKVDHYLLPGKRGVRKVSTQGSVYSTRGILVNIKYAVDDWQAIGNNALDNIDIFVFICGEPDVFYSIPREEMRKLIELTPSNNYDKRKEFHIYPSSHTYYAPGGVNLDISRFYHDWSILTSYQPTANDTSLPTKREVYEEKSSKKQKQTITYYREAASDKTIPQRERRWAKIQYLKAVRDWRFRRNVLSAYDYKCAICGIQLGLVQAAHIDPVSKKGTDEITNGIALCMSHHRAYDDGLIVIDEDYKIRLNDRKVKELRIAKFDQGLESFEKSLRIGETIYFPNDRKHTPSKEYILRRLVSEGLTRR